MPRYNGLNAVKVDLAKAGICKQDGRRFTDPLCTHATDEQIAYTLKLDADIDEEYERGKNKSSSRVWTSYTPLDEEASKRK